MIEELGYVYTNISMLVSPLKFGVHQKGAVSGTHNRIPVMYGAYQWQWQEKVVLASPLPTQVWPCSPSVMTEVLQSQNKASDIAICVWGDPSVTNLILTLQLHPPPHTHTSTMMIERLRDQTWMDTLDSGVASIAAPHCCHEVCYPPWGLAQPYLAYSSLCSLSGLESNTANRAEESRDWEWHGLSGECWGWFLVWGAAPLAS